jgi:HSP20 family protein
MKLTLSDSFCRRGHGPTGLQGAQLFLGDTLDTEKIDASYDAGVLKLRIPVAEQAKPRRIAVSGGSDRKELNS